MADLPKGLLRPVAVLMGRWRAAGWLVLVPCFATAVGCGGLHAAGSGGLAAGTRSGPAAAGSWGRARQVPGTEPMSRQYAGDDGKAAVGIGISSVACPAPRECAASGGYVDETFNFLVFVTGQHSGQWANAVPAPGAADLAANGDAAQSQMSSGPFLSEVACSSADNCALAGNYQAPDPAQDTRPLLAIERAGVWGQAQPVSGQATAVLTISCPPGAAGQCVAGGLSQAGYSGPASGFVVTESRGVWGRAQPVPGSTGAVTAMSCPAAGSCLAGGSGYLAGSDYPVPPYGTAFLASENGGRWGPARPVPGLSRLTSGKSAVDSISCAGVGDCAVGGAFKDLTGRVQLFVADERSGVWGQAQPVPGLAALNMGGRALLTQVSCGLPGDCAAGGWYLDQKQLQQAWVATETDGRWGRAEEVPATAALNARGNAALTSISCTAAGCAAGGWYTGGVRRHTQTAFLATERRGTWRAATQVPGLAALNPGGDTFITAVSCAPSGWCAAVGDYIDAASTETRMFVVTQR